MKIVKNKIIIYLSGAIAVITVSLYVFLFSPEIKELTKKSRECKEIENYLHDTRKSLISLKKFEAKNILITEKEIPMAIAELINNGKRIGINYISIASQPIIDKGDPQFKILSLELDIESVYREIIEFISMFGKLENSLVTLGNFSITPDSADKERVKVKLIVNMYISKGS